MSRPTLRLKPCRNLLIAAMCARPFAHAAARAGHDVIVLDAFADADTRRLARQAHKIAYADGRFDADDLMQVLCALDLSNCDGLVYGSGFEAVPHLLEQTAQYLPLIGNSPDTLRVLKQPRLFFSLLDALDISHPEISFRPPQDTSGWLHKHGGGSGGTHVQRLHNMNAASVDIYAYYQREHAGEPVSLLFAADGNAVRAVGFNIQWLAPSSAMPFRYGGAASQVLLPQNVQLQFLQSAQKITAKVGLRGLNSLDALIKGDKIQVLEVNPRLSATFDLYNDKYCNLFDLHLRACAGDLSNWPQISLIAKAQHIVYATQDCVIPQAFAWPTWTADLPEAGSMIRAGDPLCSVTAESGDALQAKTAAMARAQTLLRSMLFD